MGLFSKLCKLVLLNSALLDKCCEKRIRFTNFEWNERRKNPDSIEGIRDFVCVLVAEGGFFVRFKEI